MRNAARRFRNAALFACVALAPATSAPNGTEEKARLLTRSIYLPVELRLCEHLRDSVLYQDDRPVSLLPAKRIFQFTYYPNLQRIEPASTEVRVEGFHLDGSPFTARLAAAPWGVFTANERIELDMNEQLRKMRYKLDVRYRTVSLTLRCDDFCDKETAADDGAHEER